MFISIVICTYNRAFLLPDLLASLGQQQVPSGDQIELLVINNNSSDDTEQVALAAAEQCPFPVRVLTETRLGVSHARNRGWQEACGEYVLYLDDDAVPKVGWLERYSAALNFYHPEVAGGPIEPTFGRRIPKWLDPDGPHNQDYVARLDLGPETRWLSGTEHVWAGNFAVRRDVFAKVNGFSPTFGIIGKRRLSGEETDLQFRILNTGGRILYVSDAAILHPLLPEKLRLSYYLRQIYERGISLSQLRLSHARHLEPTRRWKARCALRQGLSALGAFSRGKTSTGALRLGECAHWLGQIKGAYADDLSPDAVRVDFRP